MATKNTMTKQKTNGRSGVKKGGVSVDKKKMKRELTPAKKMMRKSTPIPTRTQSVTTPSVAPNKNGAQIKKKVY